MRKTDWGARLAELREQEARARAGKRRRPAVEHDEEEYDNGEEYEQYDSAGERRVGSRWLPAVVILALLFLLVGGALTWRATATPPLCYGYGPERDNAFFVGPPEKPHFSWEYLGDSCRTSG